MKTRKSESTIYRDFVVRCRANKGGKHLIPIAISEVIKPSSDPLLEYDVLSTSECFGDLRAPLEKRGDLVRLKNGQDRITRTPHIGKEVRSGRFVFVHFRIQVREFKLFTKRTENPKLSWLMGECKAAGLRVFIEGQSAHAPCSFVHRDDFDAAWKILGPVDAVRDDAPRFRR